MATARRKHADKAVNDSAAPAVSAAQDVSQKDARRQVASNVLSVQNARKESQALAKKAPDRSSAPSSLSRDYAGMESEQRAKAQPLETKTKASALDRRGWIP